MIVIVSRVQTEWMNVIIYKINLLSYMKSHEKEHQTMSNLLDNVSIRVRKWYFSQHNQYIFILQTFNNQSNEPVQSVTRNLSDIDSLSTYIIKEYGGLIVPIIQSSRVLVKNVETIADKIQQYLEDLRINEHSSKDSKFYCFIFEQAMAFPQEEKYTKVLNNASILSKKYLNTIFTRKQLPQEKQAQNLVNIYDKLKIKFVEYEDVKQLTQNAISEERFLQQIKSLISEMSGSLCLAAQLQQSKMIQTEKILQMSDRYLVQTKEAFSRWEILVEAVRELQNNLFKGLHEDEFKFQNKSLQLKLWTQSLREELQSMLAYFDSIIAFLCNFVQELKRQTINCDLSCEQQIFSQPQYQQNLQGISNNIQNEIEGKNENQCSIDEEDLTNNKQQAKNAQSQLANTSETLNELEGENYHKEQSFSA